MRANVGYLDCSAGMSEELFLAALLDAGLPLDALNEMLASLPIRGYQLKHTPVQRNGMRGSSIDVVIDNSSSPPMQSVRSLVEVIALFQTVNLPAHVQEIALSILRRMEEAYAAIQGSTFRDAPFSDAEALKIVVCVAGIAFGITFLNIAQLYASPLPLTGGSIETPDGVQPVPTPVVLELLRRVEAPWQPSSLEGERVTVVGAATLATLARFEKPAFAISRVGYAFHHDLSTTPEHVLSLYIGRETDHLQSTIASAGEHVEDADTDWVAVIETHIDTMTGELLGGLMERLFALGALDVSYTPLQMKKNRPATLVTVICPPEQGDRFALVLLRETSTLGVRIQQVRRLKAQREQRRIDTPLGPVIVKVKRLGPRIISTSPEYEECRRIARERDIPLADVYEIVRQAIKNVIIEI